MSINNQAIAFGLAGALALGAVATASAGPMPINPGVKSAGPVTDVAWRGRGFGRGFGPGAAVIGGLAAGALIGSAVAGQPYGGYYAEPGYAYEPGYGYGYDTPAPYYSNYGYNGGWGKCYTDEGYGRRTPCDASTR